MPAVSAASKPAPSRAAYEFTVEDVEYLSHDGSPLLLRLFKPKGAGPFPLMIDLHGGAWCGQDRTSDALFNEALAKSGVVVAALDWRMPPVAGYPASLADINYATRWLKARAGELKARPGRVGMIGISSGGHQAMLAAMRPRDKRYAAIPLAGHPGLDATVAAVVDGLAGDRSAAPLPSRQAPTGGGRQVPRADRPRDPAAHQVLGHRGGDGGRQPRRHPRSRRGRRHAARSLRAGRRRHRASQGRPRALRRASYRKRGGEVDLALYEGEGGGFIRDPASKAAPLAMQRILDFVHARLG